MILCYNSPKKKKKTKIRANVSFLFACTLGEFCSKINDLMQRSQTHTFSGVENLKKTSKLVSMFFVPRQTFKNSLMFLSIAVDYIQTQVFFLSVFYFYLFFEKEKVSPCSAGCPGTHLLRCSFCLILLSAGIIGVLQYAQTNAGL